jgi:hypothetical protein
MATIEQISDAMHRVPFTPFTVRLVDGRAFTVNHPDFVAVSPEPRGRGVTIYEGKRVHDVDILLNQSVDRADRTKDVEASPEGNGVWTVVENERVNWGRR